MSAYQPPGNRNRAESPAGRFADVREGFDPDCDVRTDAWERLKRVLEDPRGGTIGLSGPRGIGKTWTMRHAREWAEQRGGLGVWFPSPSEYEPAAFLAALADVTPNRTPTTSTVAAHA